MLVRLSAWSSFNQSGANGGSVVLTELLAPGVPEAALQLATRKWSCRGSLNWSERPGAVAGQGATAEYLTLSTRTPGLLVCAAGIDRVSVSPLVFRVPANSSKGGRNVP